MPDGAQEYLKVQVKTASQDQLLLMLLDGAVRFVEGALERQAAGDREAKGALLLKAENIILELVQSLSPTIGEKVYGNLIGLYKFIYGRLVDGNLRDDPASIGEGLRILKDVRETWRQAVASYRSGLDAPMARKAQAPAAGICVQA